MTWAKTHARRYKLHAFAAHSQARENILHKSGVLPLFTYRVLRRKPDQVSWEIIKRSPDNRARPFADKKVSGG